MTCIQRFVIFAFGMLTAYISFVLCKREKIFSGPLLGIVTVAIVLLSVAVLDPEAIKVGDLSILARKVNKIEKNLRPFAVMEYPSGKLLYSSLLLMS